MPWVPDFVGAVELARRQTREAGHSDPAMEYLNALQSGATRDLETVWPGEVVVYDPRAGEVRGHRHLRSFVRHSQILFAQRHATIETVATARVEGRAVVEIIAHLDDAKAQRTDWPLAVVAESHDDLSVVFRTYCSQVPVDGKRHLRTPILTTGDTYPGGVVARFLTALEAGDTDAVVNTFTSDGYLREPIGSSRTHRGHDQLRAYFDECFGAGGGIRLEHCAMTDDATRCALEYNCVRWGPHNLPAQAGIAIFERGGDRHLKAVRIYDDVVPPTAES